MAQGSQLERERQEANKDRLGTIEPVVLAALAMHGGLKLVLHGSTHWWAWAVIVVMAALAALGTLRMWPLPGVLARAGVALLAAELYTIGTAGRSLDDTWVWLLIVAATYPLLLPRRWGVVVSAVAGALAVISFSHNGDLDSVNLVARAGSIFVTGLLATQLGRSLAAAESAVQEAIEGGRKFAALAGNTTDALVICDAASLVSFASGSLGRVLGYEPNEMVGRPVSDFVHSDDRVGFIDRWSDLVASADNEFAYETRMRHRTGRWVWIEMRAANRLANPAVRCAVMSIHDITQRRAAIEALRRSEELFRTLARSSPLGIFRTNSLGETLYVNERWQEITGLSSSDAGRVGWQGEVHPTDAKTTPIAQHQIALTRMAWRFRILHPVKGVRWVSVNLAPIIDEQSHFAGNVGTIDDVTEQMVSQADTARLTAIIEATTDQVMISDAGGRLMYLNEAARRMSGLTPDASIESLDLTAVERYPVWAQARIAEEGLPAVRQGQVWNAELAILDAEDREVPISQVLLGHEDESGTLQWVASVNRDITERKTFEQRLEHQATHDPLTGLPNRTLLLDRLGIALARSRRNGNRVAVLFCDLDNFKVVNDSLGHDVGDRLLVTMAERLIALMRPSDTVARFGGDEFVVLCDDLGKDDDALAIAERLADAVTQPLDIGAHEVFVSTSIGIAYFRDVHERPEDLIRDADAAMYRAKEKGRDRYEVFDDEMRARAIVRLDTERALRRALERRELRLHYQPKIDLRDGRLTSFEALLRWEHPERGLLSPNEFISLTEETGLIVPIGAWAMGQACRELRRWHATHPELAHLRVSINLSARQVAQPDLVSDVAEVIDETGVDPSKIEFEITESVLMADAAETVALLRKLKALGVNLAVDDFGTGYSSLAYLRRFPVDILKIDRAFVAGLGRDPDDAEIVRLVITLAHGLGLLAVAEGVETRLQLDELAAMGCDRGQGYFIAKPMSASAVDAWLDRGIIDLRTVHV
ncbi:MAG: EAL domain-containing protein [Acidimicrobiia bacterium]